MASPQMFIVVATKRSEDVRAEIEKLFDGDDYDLTSDSWLVAFEGTTRALADRLGIREGTMAAGWSHRSQVTAVALHQSFGSGSK